MKKRLVKKSRTPKRKKTVKGALIRGMTERIPKELLHDPVFIKALKKIMVGYAGVYALYREDNLYYVGLARSLFSRLRAHTRDRHKKRWQTFSIYRINRVGFLKDIETLLLRVAIPRGNRVTGHLHKDANLSRMLRSVAMQKQKSIDGLLAIL